MKRLIPKAMEQIRQYLMSIDQLHDEFYGMATDIDFSELPTDLDLTGHKVEVMNVLHPDCHIRVTLDQNGNQLNIKLPVWLQTALFTAADQGLAKSISLLEKLRYEDMKNFKREEIWYSNRVS